jgi:CRP-like cAMP-binding protein
MDKADFLAKVSIFSHLKKKDLNRVAKLTEVHLFHEGDAIIREGDRDGRLFIIITGEVEVIKNLGNKNERCLQTLGTHSYFGEMALLDDFVRSASVVAEKDTQVLILDQWNLRQELEKYPVVALELLQMLSRRVRAVEKTVINTLGTLLPICANCKRIREKNGSWTQLEAYIADHSESELSQDICPECAKKGKAES